MRKTLKILLNPIKEDLYVVDLYIQYIMLQTYMLLCAKTMAFKKFISMVLFILILLFASKVEGSGGTKTSQLVSLVWQVINLPLFSVFIVYLFLMFQKMIKLCWDSYIKLLTPQLKLFPPRPPNFLCIKKFLLNYKAIGTIRLYKAILLVNGSMKLDEPHLALSLVWMF